MAWVEQIGTRLRRCGYSRRAGGHGSVAWFRLRKAAQDLRGGPGVRSPTRAGLGTLGAGTFSWPRTHPHRECRALLGALVA
jgi:hypothetical protein